MTLTDEQLREWRAWPYGWFFGDVVPLIDELLVARARLREMEGALRDKDRLRDLAMMAIAAPDSDDPLEAMMNAVSAVLRALAQPAESRIKEEPEDDEALLRQAYARSLACDEINDELWNGAIKRGAIQELSIKHLLTALRAARASSEAKS